MDIVTQPYFTQKSFELLLLFEKVGAEELFGFTIDFKANAQVIAFKFI